MIFRNTAENQCDVTAEEAFTSEGGYLAFENDMPEKDPEAGREVRNLSSDFGATVGRYSEGMRAALTFFCRGRKRHATRLDGRAVQRD